MQNKCLLIGITGGIATGKSTLTNMLRKKGYKVIDADIISREVVDIGKPAYYDIVSFFGQGILLEDKNINRKKLGKLIFSYSDLRKKLNEIVHPRVFEEIFTEIQNSCKDNQLVFVDIPLLFETIKKPKPNGLNFDEIWVVYIDYDTQLKRLMARDNITEDEAVLKINSQMSLEEKAKMATRVIYNDKDIDRLEENLDIILEQLNL